MTSHRYDTTDSSTSSTTTTCFLDLTVKMVVLGFFRVCVNAEKAFENNVTILVSVLKPDTRLVCARSMHDR